MTNFKLRLRISATWPWYPFLLAVYPVLNLYAINAEWLRIAWTFPALVMSLSATCVIFACSWFVTRSVARAGLIAALIVMLFFSYGHAFDILEQLLVKIDLSEEIVGRNRYLLTFWFALFAGALTLICLIPRHWIPTGSFFLNVFASTIVLMTLPVALVNSGEYRQNVLSVAYEPLQLPFLAGQEKPDIYMIVLDEYVRNDVLEYCYGFDNSEFTDWLQERGFIVPSNSHSNYTQTVLSLASMLNMEYLDYTDDSTTRTMLFPLIEKNRVEQSLRNAGYRVIRISSGWMPTTETLYVDEILGSEMVPRNFENTLLSTTLYRAFHKSSDLEAISSPELILFAFQKLTDFVTLPVPTYVFAHIVSPHPPYYFDADGNRAVPKAGVVPSYDKEGYVGQVRFLNRKVQALIDKLLQGSKQPIIVLQSDHGVWGGVCGAGDEDVAGTTLDQEGMELKLRNFSAYYLPGGVANRIYSSITPVNIFRLIFQEYFDVPIALLEDKSYYSHWRTPFQFTRVLTTD